MNAALDSLSLLRRLLAATSPSNVRKVLAELGDRDDLAPDEVFGANKFVWKTYGGRQTNISTINIATKPGRSLAERVTNAIDAILEERAVSSPTAPKSAREAMQKWFSRPLIPESNEDTNWYKQNAMDRKIHVLLQAGETQNQPTVDVLDTGIGIAPSLFPNTILSLQEGNKVSRFYQVGLFGQGGSASLGFSTYVLIVSRRKDCPGKIGFTLIRLLRLDDTFKEDCFAYLGIENSGQTEILTALTEDALALYSTAEKHKAPDFTFGTLVRHYGFRLEGLDKSLQASPGNLWHYINAIMFDPLIPLRLWDLRDPEAGKHKNELISGSRNRLLRLKSPTPDIEEEDKGSQVRYYRPIEYIVPVGSEVPSLAVELWVVLNFKTRQSQSILRSSSSELYVQPSHPIVFTVNGQNQGELSGQIIRESGYTLLSKHLVIHIDATRTDKKTKRELFAATREGLKDGPVLTSVLDYLKKMLQEDQRLAELEKELSERISKRDSEATKDEVRKQVAKLLKDAGIEVEDDGSIPREGEGDIQEVQRERRKRPIRPREPLPTLPFPDVTFLKIVWPQPHFNVHREDAESIAIETDADSEYDIQNRIAIRSEPPLLELATKSPLRGGRMRWRLRPKSTSKAGDSGSIIVTLTRPNGSQLYETIPYTILAELQKPAKSTPGKIPPFEIHGIDPELDSETWATVWSESTWPDVSGEEPTAADTVAYKLVKSGARVYVYYSKVFKPYVDALNRLKRSPATHTSIFKDHYEIWIAYHAIIQDARKGKEYNSVDEQIKDQLMDKERSLVATMQIKQTLRFVELMAELQKNAAA